MGGGPTESSGRMRDEVARLEALLALLPVGVVFCDPAGAIVRHNAAAEEVWGAIPDVSGFAGYGVFRAWSADDGSPIGVEDWGLYRAVHDGETSAGEVLDILRFDDWPVTIVASAAPVRAEDGRIIGGVALMQDVSEMRRLRTHAAIVRGAGRIVSASTVAEREELIGEMLREVFETSSVEIASAHELVGGGPADEQPVWLDTAQRALSTASVAVARYEGRPLLAIPAAPPTGEARVFVVQLPDAQPLGPTELEAADRIMRLSPLFLEEARMVESTEQLARAREEWLADLAHDLRTPLSTIRGYADLLSRGIATREDEVRREAGLIARQAASIEQMLEDLQTAFQLRCDHLPVSPVTADLMPLVAEAVETAMWRAGRPRSDVVFRSPEQPLEATIDVAHFPRIVANLVTNALIHNPEGTRVTVSLHAENDSAVLTVEDNGKGMDAELVARVLERGEQGAAPGSGKGSGLGMTIARELADAMCGGFELSSEPGRGTVVRVTVPLRAAAPAVS